MHSKTPWKRDKRGVENRTGNDWLFRGEGSFLLLPYPLMPRPLPAQVSAGGLCITLHCPMASSKQGWEKMK